MFDVKGQSRYVFLNPGNAGFLYGSRRGEKEGSVVVSGGVSYSMDKRPAGCVKYNNYRSAQLSTFASASCYLWLLSSGRPRFKFCGALKGVGCLRTSCIGRLVGGGVG